jgi:hypothetical protein
MVSLLVLNLMRFGTRLHTEFVGRFGTSTHAQTGETPYIQHNHFGATIAPRWSGGLGESPTSRPCEPSRPALVSSLLKIVVAMRAWTVHYGRDVYKNRKSIRAVIYPNTPMSVTLNFHTT